MSSIVSPMPISNILLYCRPGFEKECASEIIAATNQAELSGYINAKPDTGFVLYNQQTTTDINQLNQLIDFSKLVFSRQCIFSLDIIKDLPNDDRITPLINIINELGLTFCDALLETADTNEAKQLSTFCKKFSNPLLKALKNKQLIAESSHWRLHLFFLDSSSVYIGVSHVANSSNLFMGIPRLRMPRSAPSRSTLKLEEAFKYMLSEDEHAKYLCNGMTAVDLGASPGGWTWQLVNRQLRVIAIDNGKMDQSLLDTGMVEHINADGFKFYPDKPVDWLVCDMVERPLHISRLIARWLVDKQCQYAAFNLKLPMKKRYQAVIECREIIESQLREKHIKFDFRIKQLYHDREEVTCIILLNT
jgi:23S rRNA (cytidine2498-2'-O)-methyltransferase